MGNKGSKTHYVPEDENGNLTLLDHKLGANSMARFEYGYDRNGMRTSMTDLDGLHEYGYDALYQIVRATHPTATNPLEQFQYDAAGNRLADVYRAYSYNELNQLVEDDSATYAYDFDGNIVLKVDKATGDSTRYEWDIENRLVRVVKPGVVAEYVYDALGRRVAKTVNGVRTEFRYDGEDLILTMDDAGTVTGSWTLGPGIDQPLAMNRGGEMHYYLADGLGSIRALADSAGVVDQTYEYSVFGEITKDSGNVENPFAYTAREWEPEVGLYYYRARWYEATVGRFLSEDPLGLNAGDFNLYRYVRNNLANATDPLGLWCIPLPAERHAASKTRAGYLKEERLLTVKVVAGVEDGILLTTRTVMTYERFLVRYRVTERQFCCEKVCCGSECDQKCRLQCGVKRGATTVEEKYERGRFLYKEGPTLWAPQDMD